MFELTNRLNYPDNLLTNIEAYRNDVDTSSIGIATILDDTITRIQNVLDSLKYCWFCADKDILEVFFAYFIKHKSIEELSIEVKWNQSLVIDRITNIIKVLSLDLYYNIIFSIDDPDVFSLDQTYIGFDKRTGNTLKRYRDDYEFNNAGIETVQDIKVFLERNNNNFAALGNIRGIGDQSIEGIKLLIELFDKYFKVEITSDDDKDVTQEDYNNQNDIIIKLQKENESLKDKIKLLEMKDIISTENAEVFVNINDKVISLDKSLIKRAITNLLIKIL